MRHFDGIARDLFSGDNINRNDGIMRDYYRFMIAEVEEKSGSDLTDYTVKADLSTIDWNSIRNDGNDIRIVHESKELDRILEDFSKAAKTGNVWFKVSAISANSKKKFLMLYGNQAADAPPADGQKVYTFYDDFESGTLDKWSLSYSPVVGKAYAYSGNYGVKVYGDTVNYIYKDISGFGKPLILQAMYKKVTGWGNIGHIGPYRIIWPGSGVWVRGYDGVNTFYSSVEDDTEWHKAMVKITPMYAKYTVDDDVDFGTTYADTSLNVFTIRSTSKGAEYWADLALIRKYVDPEPSVSLRWT